MTPEQLLRDSDDVAEHSSAGVQKLETRKAAKEKILNGARLDLRTCEAAEAALGAQHAGVNAKLAQLSRDIEKSRGTNSALVLKALASSDVTTVLTKCAASNRSLADQTTILRETLEHIVVELLPSAAIRTTEARIALAEASRDWVLAAAHADLLQLTLELAPAMRRDESLSIGLGPGSRAFGYCEKINRYDIEATDLRMALRQQTAAAQKQVMEAQV